MAKAGINIKRLNGLEGLEGLERLEGSEKNEKVYIHIRAFDDCELCVCAANGDS